MTYSSRAPIPIVLCVLLTASGATSMRVRAASAADPVILSNEYVSASVNNSSDGMGRFSLSTTGGDPSTSRDDNKPLIYGGSDPWTSFTTVRVDGRDYIYGGPSSRRAGKSGLYGTVTAPLTVQGESVRMSTRVGGLDVSQVLSLARSTTTGHPDTLRVDYDVRNASGVVHSVGLRVVLDTMLGQNDGAPFRVPSGAVHSSMALSGPAIPEFWQAFDSLRSPTIRAQGTLRGEGVSPPDEVVFSDWGTLADAPWTDDVPTGKDFIRKGEDEPDTATALMWDSAILRPGEERRYSTYYGLGGVTVSSSDDVSLGVTSPADVVLGKGGVGSVPVIAYLENGTAKDLQAVTVSIRLPAGAVLEGGQSADRTVKALSAFSDYQCAWSIVPLSGRSGPITYEVQVATGGRVINRVTRDVNIQGPPALQVWVNGGPVAGLSGVVRVKATVKNLGNRRADDAVLAAKVPRELIPARNEALTRAIGFIEPGASVTANWTFYTDSKGSALVSVTAASTNAEDAAESRLVRLD